MSGKNLAIQGFDVERKSCEYLTKLKDYMQSNFDSLINKFLIQFEQYCRKIILMQESGKKASIGFIHLSILRTNILSRRHIIRMDAYDENWYADRVECAGEYDVSEIYMWFAEFADALETAGKTEYSRAKLRDIQHTMFEESNKYHLIVAELVRVGLKSAAETEWFKQVKRNKLFAVCIGGYQDKSDILYKEDSTPKNAKTVKHHLEENLPVYTHEICKNLDLSNGDYEDMHLLFSNFSGCDFSGSNLKNAVIMFSNFKRTVIRNADMGKTQIFDTDFSGAVLENVKFYGSKLNHLSFVGAELINVTFEGTILAEDLDFDQVTLVDTVIPIKQSSR